jgi:PIN domain
MIILDTNQLRSNRTLDTPMLGLLRAIATHTGHVLAIPSLVEQEFLAAFARDVAEVSDEIENAVKKLMTLDREWAGPPLSMPNPDSAAEAIRVRLREIFTILETTPESSLKALQREITRQPPAYEGGGSGLGARDAAIWLTTLEALRLEQVYFVARDKRAYGELVLHPSLQQEADAIAQGQLRFCPEVVNLLDLLAQETEYPTDEVRRLASSELARSELSEALKAPLALGQIISYLPVTTESFPSWMASTEPNVEAIEIGETRAYAVADRRWVCSRIRWAVRQTVTINQATPNFWIVSASIPATVLFELEEGSTLSKPQILAIGRYELGGVQPWTVAGSAQDELRLSDVVSGPRGQARDELRLSDSASSTPDGSNDTD